MFRNGSTFCQLHVSMNILRIFIALKHVSDVDLIAFWDLGENDLVAASFKHVMLLGYRYLWELIFR